MIFIEAYIKKCLDDSKYYTKTSFIGAGVISLILFIIEIFKGTELSVAIFGFVIMTLIFVPVWKFAVKQLQNVFRKQDGYIERDNKNKYKKKKKR